MNTPLTIEETLAVVEELDALVYFPQVPPRARLLIAEEIVRMIGGADLFFRGQPHSPRMRLNWLAGELLLRVGKWEGVQEMRGVYCSVFKPADGVDVYSSHAAFSPSEDPEPARVPAYLPQPGDVPCGDIQKRLGEAAKMITDGK